MPSKTSLNRNIWVTGRRALSPLIRDRWTGSHNITQSSCDLESFPSTILHFKARQTHFFSSFIINYNRLHTVLHTSYPHSPAFPSHPGCPLCLPSLRPSHPSILHDTLLHTVMHGTLLHCPPLPYPSQVGASSCHTMISVRSQMPNSSNPIPQQNFDHKSVQVDTG